MKRFIILLVLLCFAHVTYAFDDPFLGLFCQGNCSYTGILIYNDPSDTTTSVVSATATGNLGGNSGNMQISLFTQCGGACHYSLANDPGCLSPAYVFTFAGQCGCGGNGNIFHFCYQDAGAVCQETYSGGWNADSTNKGAYFFIHMQSSMGSRQSSGQCPADRPATL